MKSWFLTLVLAPVLFIAGWLSSVSSRTTRVEKAVAILTSHDYKVTEDAFERIEVVVNDLLNEIGHTLAEGSGHENDAELKTMSVNIELLKSRILNDHDALPKQALALAEEDTCQKFFNRLVENHRSYESMHKKFEQWKSQHPK